MRSRWRTRTAALFIYFIVLLRVAKKSGRGMWGKSLRFVVALFLQSAVGFISLGRRFEILAYLYAWFRQIDDVLDGDASLPVGETHTSYCGQKQQLVEALRERGFDSVAMLSEDVLIRYAVNEARRFGVDLVPEIIALWGLVRWDSERRRNASIALREELYQFATTQDECVLMFFCQSLRWESAALLRACCYPRRCLDAD